MYHHYGIRSPQNQKRDGLLGLNLFNSTVVVHMDPPGPGALIIKESVF